MSAEENPFKIANLNPHERETVVTMCDGDDLVSIWTAQRRQITRLRKHASYTETGSGYHGTTEWASFSIPASEWNVSSGAKVKRKPMSEEQRKVAAERLANTRKGGK